MKAKLFELLGISEEKKNLLLLLHNSPKKSKTILESMGISRQALVPHTLLLEENGLITRKDDTYELTGVGKITVCEMIPFLETLDFLDDNSSLLRDYDLDFIPPDLLECIHELGPLKIKEPPLSELHEPGREFIDTVSTSFSFITTFMYPAFTDLTSVIMERGSRISLIISQKMFDKLRNDCYDDFKSLLEKELASAYLYPDDIGLISFGLTDTCLLLRLLKVKDGFDNKIITACSRNAVEWGRELFECYRIRSIPITDI
ncbi:MAG: DUF1724 domain-containing protein [Methanosarcinaceae archaeon]|nr:DUF1724 domain-containing protein [Methanosarcinaceae archaeon]